jgi:sigma-B regulation protein RsbU (phosphoserine phosphatase)
VFGFTVPARHVGGDCYDVVDIGDGRLAFTIGDVAGKGAPAALLMANVQATVRALTDTCESPRELVGRLNRLICDLTEDDVFVTFFYGVLDWRTGELRYVNAGHNPPFVLRADGHKEYLGEGGLVIGLLPGAEYTEGGTCLVPGDNLVLYTDGVTEATNPQDEMFGVARLEKLLGEHRLATAREIEERVYTGIKDFAAGAPQADDLTMVVLKIDGATSGLMSIARSGSPREAKGGPPAARGTPAMGGLWGPAEAAAWTDPPWERAQLTLARAERNGAALCGRPRSFLGHRSLDVASAHLRKRSF